MSNAQPTTTYPSSSSLAARQETTTATDTTSSSSSPSPSNPGASSSSSMTASSLGATLPKISVLPDSPDVPLYSIGPYVCTTTINLSTLISQFLDYIQKSDNTLEAHLTYLVLHMHAVKNDSSINTPAPAPSVLPGPANLLGALFSANLSAFMYTPANLRSDRANLNSTWYTVAERYRPVQDYYSTVINEYNIVSTEDGWPSESYIEFSKNKRLLLQFGNIDPQMEKYNLSGDEDVIFPRGYIQDDQEEGVDDTSSGPSTRGCYLTNSTHDMSQVNSSWATIANFSGLDHYTAPDFNITSLLNLTSNLTNCGISPILNVTLLNSTARDNYIPYQNFSYSTIWSWAPSEPRNYTSGDASSSSLFRCATLNSDLNNRWVVQDCSEKYYASCRADGQPYNWTITTYPISYSYAPQACPDSYAFAAPRTALENAYLGQAVRDARRDYDGHGVWVDFNSLSVRGCWVMGGPNATCPYDNVGTASTDDKRQILVRHSIPLVLLLSLGKKPNRKP